MGKGANRDRTARTRAALGVQTKVAVRTCVPQYVEVTLLMNSGRSGS